MAALAYHAVAAVDRILGGDPLEPLSDPLLDPAGAGDPNPLDVVDAAWGQPASAPGFPARMTDRAARRTTACVDCDDTGFVVTHEDGGAGYRPCFRCPREGDAA